MFMKPILAAAAVAFALPALAGDITIKDAYARASTPVSKSGAAFMVIENAADQPDQLIAARSDIAAKLELHTHKQDANGVMHMMEVPGGFPIPAHGSHVLARGGDHIMLLGLHKGLTQGETFKITLTFRNAGDVTVEVPVDLKRMPKMGGMKMDN
ncbi:copper chaperone PCu(A)C [Acidimangrovimonas pyrenivorans]|uniref:Copper chaperone PCu(A)C n=1 Tax=Acidimangrovimonas pyrenivorans TaxID=2030798 RepID=A0ABV7AB47_9RHOB